MVNKQPRISQERISLPTGPVPNCDDGTKYPVQYADRITLSLLPSRGFGHPLRRTYAQGPIGSPTSEFHAPICRCTLVRLKKKKH